MASLPKSAGIPSVNMILELRTVDTSPVSYVAVANLGDFTGPTFTVTEADTSKHGDDWERVVTTIKKAGEVSGPIWFDPANSTHADADIGLYGLYLSQDLRAWRITMQDSNAADAHLMFQGYVSAFSLKFPVKGVLSADFKLRIDGEVTDDFVI